MTRKQTEEAKFEAFSVMCEKVNKLEKENAELKEKLGDVQMQKAGETKWHKVADGDLPKENNLYLVAIKDNGLAIAYFNGLHWETKFNLGDFGHCLETVIAWCEIPEYTEE